MKKEIIHNLFTKIIPQCSYCAFKENGEFSVVTIEEVEGPLPLNATAAKILSLCDGERRVTDIYEELKKEYDDVEEDKLFHDLTFCIRNFEVLHVIQPKYL